MVLAKLEVAITEVDTYRDLNFKNEFQGSLSIIDD
jgi:hypothetical protein